MNKFQLIYPGMHPFTSGIFTAFLSFVALIGVVFIYSGIKRIVTRKTSFTAILFLVTGIAGISYPLMNMNVYNRIYHANEIRIIGDFHEDSSSIPLRVHADHTWTYQGRNLACKSGTWEYVPSEDWCYWHIQSDGEIHCSVQTGNPNIIRFPEKWFAFKKKNRK